MPMTSLRRLAHDSYLKITNSIAFYPSMIALGCFFLSILVMVVEYTPPIMQLKSIISILLVKSDESARAILNTLVGSIISLMVFSFSMVMVVLNRSSSALTPRVIPGFITNKPNQIVLGVYLGTIIYTLILFINIQTRGDSKFLIPSFGILIAMVFAIVCLALFVYFIHTISQSIHVDTVLNQIYKATQSQMDKISAEGEHTFVEPPDTSQWRVLNAGKVGYLKTVEYGPLLKLCEKHDMQIRVREKVGFFFIGEYPYIEVSKQIDEKTEQALRECFLFYPEDYLSDHYVFGMKQISEIAVKAMSPGINDPGTAVKAIDMLSVLLVKKMSLRERNCYCDSKGVERLFLPVFELEQLLYDNLTPIRKYARQDAVVMYNLLESMRNLLAVKESRDHRPVLCRYVTSMRDSCQVHINNPLDIDMINKMIAQINLIIDPKSRLEPISLSEVQPDP